MPSVTQAQAPERALAGRVREGTDGAVARAIQPSFHP